MPISTIPDNAKDFYFDVAAGNIPGKAKNHKFGGRTTRTTSEEDVWGGAAAAATNDTLPFLATASTVQVKAGGNAADVDATGAGARTIIVQGLDENWDEAEETIALAGASASSATTTTFIRIFRAAVTGVGTYYIGAVGTGRNQGNIIIEETTGSTEQSIIPAFTGQTVGTHYTVPAGKTLYMKRDKVTMDSNKTSDFFLNVRSNADDTSVPVSSVRKVSYRYGMKEPDGSNLDIPKVFSEKTDIWFSIISAASGTVCEIEYDYILEDD